MNSPLHVTPFSIHFDAEILSDLREPHPQDALA